MNLCTSILAVATLLVAPAAAGAQETGKPVDRASVGPEGKMGLQVTNYAFKVLEGTVPPGKTLRLMIIAKQRAIATACEEFDIDESRYQAAMTVALEDVAKLAKDGEANPALRKTLFAYGTMLGGELAISAYNPDKYCAYGKELRAELAEDKNANLLVFKD